MISLQTGNADIVGENVMMYASDYPHGESVFPESTNIVLGGNSMPAARKHKLLWENPSRFYTEAACNPSAYIGQRSST
ncbi:MAG TPA: hypothetical protein VHX39_36655 [Acetobacteraceae bacterium]|jgi:predicted TIM-barrel fold metal-dependent hydrolase|nr:hypothetical protein [Acetobacteraceae bacterium]